ncbi:MAG: DUF1573 domain-containing protein [Bacteroidaceae bacterium]|nr:DUF1573 domain-containing protein [Bacteroidaceae bacterium]
MNLFFPPIDGQIESCGCFGEIIKFTPLTSFAKSVILLSISVIHLLYELKVLPIISKKESTHHTSLFTKFKCHFMLILFLSFISCKPNTKKHTSHGQVTYDNGVIYSDNVVYDFGDIKGSSNDTIPFTFNLTNKSEHVLTIEKVEASCPCVSVSSYAKEITAGQATKLSGNIDISKTKGKLNKPIFVRYNDGQIMILRIKGIVR